MCVVFSADEYTDVCDECVCVVFSADEYTDVCDECVCVVFSADEYTDVCVLCSLQGNDQVRFELTCYALYPEVQVRSDPSHERLKPVVCL